MSNQVDPAALTSLIDQSIYTIPSLTLECGTALKEVPVAYKTWGTLNASGDNVMIICHAFTGSADVEDWWGPLIGRGKAFDPNRFFIFCANVLGSPYGSASPITLDPDTGKPYGPEFPPTTIRDDVRAHKLVLDYLGVNSVAVAIGGSMGGMAVLEWPLCSPQGYIRHVVPLATSARHSAWCISWGEAQRQSIYSDPLYQDGFYYIESGKQPAAGLAAARMSALLTYRSRDSFERRFGRKPQLGRGERGAETPPLESPKSQADEALAAHNDGHKGAKSRGTQPPSPTSPDGHQPPSVTQQILREALQSPSLDISPLQKPQVFSAQSYLRYQGDKFTARFDANCYIHITRKMDTHDIARGRRRCAGEPGVVEEKRITGTGKGPLDTSSRALVISIETDGLFTTTEQRELAAHIPQAELVVIPSEDGHDGFLLEFERINEVVSKFLRREYPEMYEGVEEDQTELEIGHAFEVKKNSVFGEAEVDITSW